MESEEECEVNVGYCVMFRYVCCQLVSMEQAILVAIDEFHLAQIGEAGDQDFPTI